MTSSFLYQRGRALIELGRSEEAHALSEAITDIDARDPRGYALEAAALTWGGQPASAIPIALAGLELNARFVPLLYARRWRAPTWKSSAGRTGWKRASAAWPSAAMTPT